MVHVGFVDDGAPIVLPMIGKMGQFEDNPMAMYIHGMDPLISEVWRRVEGVYGTVLTFDRICFGTIDEVDEVNR